MIELKRPACPVCNATLLSRVYFKRTPEGPVMYKSGEIIDHDNIIELGVCPRCDRA